MKRILLFFLFGLSLLQMACNISGDAGLKKILSSSEPPVGVVFEIASGDDNGLKWAIPLVQSYAHQLRKVFPNIKLAVVSHGEEQFQLTKGNRKQYAGAHKQVASLVKDQDIDVHVCGSYAAGFGVSENDYPDFIDVADRGPAQISSYKNAGYMVLFINDPAIND